MWEKERQAVISAVKENSKWIEGNLSEFKELRFMRKLLYNTHACKKVYIAGGCFADLLQGKEPKDFDFWYASELDYTLATAAPTNVRYVSRNCVAVKHDGYLVEHINVRFGTPREILENFDFTVCKFAAFIDGSGVAKVLYHKDFFKDLQRKEIAVETTRELKQETISRIVKYSNKGFKITKKVAKLLGELYYKYPGAILEEDDHYDELRQ